jgi:hypothetical protein
VQRALALEQAPRTVPPLEETEGARLARVEMATTQLSKGMTLLTERMQRITDMLERRARAASVIEG